MAAVELINSSLFTDANLTAYYRLENGALTTDSKGSNTLTNTNSVSDGTGIFGGAADFGTPNTTKNLTVTSALGLTSSGAKTYLFWYKLSADITSGAYGIMQHTIAGLNINHFITYEYNGGTRRLQFTRLKQGVGQDTLNYNVTLGTGWNMICFTYDGTNIKGSVNNSAQGSFGSTGGNAGGGNGFVMGVDTLGNYTPGLIDDMAVFSRDLSATEITNHYSGADYVPPVSGGSPIFFGNTAIA